MARVLVLGGAGMEGAAFARRIAQEQDVSEIILADRRLAKAEKAVSEVGQKASALEVNVDDHQGLVNAMQGVDLVTNFVGPFYLHLPKVLPAVIEAKVRYYADICDDGEPVEEAFNKLDRPAKEAGTTILLGMGDGPGLSNLALMYGANKLDRVDKLHVYWGGSYLALGGGVGAGLHGWHCFRDVVPQFLDGKLVHVPPRSGSEIVKFSKGTAECFYCAQSEQYTLPRYVPGVKEVFNKGFHLPPELMEDFLRLGELGFAGEEPVEVKRGVSITPVDLTMRLHSQYWFTKGDESKQWGGLKMEVIGERDGKAVTFTYDMPPGQQLQAMDVFTSVCAQVGILMLLRGEVISKEKGVFAPEGLIDPKVFFDRLTQHTKGVGLIETETVDGKSTSREI